MFVKDLFYLYALKHCLVKNLKKYIEHDVMTDQFNNKLCTSEIKNIQ